MSAKVVVSASRMACWVVASALALAVAVFAAAPSVAQQGPGSQRGELGPGEREALERSQEAGRVRERERERRRALPGERGARERSRSAFRGQGAGAAAMTARERLGAGRRRWERPEGVVERLGDAAGVVVRGGQRSVALSSVPLWARDEAGQPVPVDLSVGAREGGFGPLASAVDTRIAGRVDGGVALDDAVSFAPVVGEGGAQGEAFADKVYYANVGPEPDTDFMVAALPTGAEALWVLRSPSAGEEHALEFSLGEGEVLEADEEVPGGAVVRRGGEVVAQVAPPSAVDAEGVVIEASYRIEDDRLVVEVAHRDEDLTYPLEVDPAVIVYGLGPNGSPGTFAGWNPFEFNCGSIAFSNVHSAPQSVTMGAGGWTQGCYGRWRYHAPGSAYVFEMDLAGMYHNSSEGMGVFYGILNGDGSSPGGGTYVNGNDPPVGVQPAAEWWPVYNAARRVCTTSFDNNGGLCPSTGNAGNLAFFGLYNNVSRGYSFAQQALVYGTTLYMGDRVAPGRPTYSGIPSSGWLRGGGSFQAAATQGGIGIKSFNVNFPAAGYSSREVGVACDRSYQAPFVPCPQSTATTIQVPANAQEGAGKSLSTSASTYERAGYSASRTVGIDASGPVVDLGGRLPPRSVEEDPASGLTEPDYSLTVAARDGDPAGANSARRSGVASIEVKVDGVRKHFASQGCGTHSCPQSTEWQFVADEFSQGEHEIEIIARDQVGNATTEELEVRVDHRTGRLDHYGFEDEQVNDRSNVGVNVANGNVLVEGGDIDIAGLGLNLGMGRAYNSRESVVDGPFGYGWTHSQAIRLQGLDGDESVRFFGPTGEAVTFVERTSRGDGSFSYDSPRGIDGDLVQTSDGAFTLELDAKEKIRFGSDGRLIRREDRNGRSMNYDSKQGPGGTRLITKITDTRDRALTITYTGDRIARIEDATGRRWSYSYDSRGDLRTYTDPDGRVTKYSYDTAHRLTQVTDPKGAATTIVYEAPYRRAARVVRAGNTTGFAYDDRSDAQCNDQGEGGEVIFAARVTDARANPTKFCVDEFAQVEQVFDAKGNRRGTGYNSDGNVTSLANGAGASTQFDYEGRDLSSATQATGAQNSFSYGTGVESHLPTGATDAGGNALTYDYDASGNLASTSALGAGETGAAEQYLDMDYNGPDDSDPEGTLRSVTDGEDNQTTFDYDSKGQLEAVTPPAGQDQTRYTYDALSRIKTMRDANDNLKVMTYDGLDRVKTVTYQNPQGANESQVTFAYDPNGNLKTRTDASGTTTYDYDPRNLQKIQTLPGGRATTYTYDAVANLTSLADAGGTVTYGYDKVNLLEVLREPAGTETAFTYDDNNQRVLTVYPNGSSQRVDFDDSERIQTVRSRRSGTDGPIVHELNYDYRDPLCQGTASHCDRELVQSVTDALRNRETAYSYDLLGRLTEAKTTSTNTGLTLERFAYDYDKASNRTSQTHDAQTTDYTYNDNNELTRSDATGLAGSTTYDYDPAGNLTASSAGFDADYNAQNQTTRMQAPRSLVDVALGTDRQATFAYAGSDQTQRTQKNTILFTDNVFGLASETAGADAQYYTRDNQGRLVSVRTPQGSHYYLTDNIGSVVALTGPGPNADVSATYRYEPYGETQDVSGDLVQPYRYAGEYLDSETGHYKIGLRYYNPQLARWTQQDPLTGYMDPRRTNPYIYAGQDPTNQTDPTGALFGVDVGDVLLEGAANAVSGAVGGAIAGAPLGLQGIAAGAAIGSAEGFAVGAAGSVARQAGAPDNVVNTAQMSYSSGRIVFGMARNVLRAIEAQ